MNILLTTLNAKFSHSSLALRYLKKYVEDMDVNIQLKEYTINNHIDHMLSEIHRMASDMVVFSTYIWNVEMILTLAKYIKRVRPETLILLGGPEVSFDSDEIMEQNSFIDFIISGEGEETFREFLSSHLSDRDYSAVLGLTYRNGKNVIKNDERGQIENLDSIPFPYDDFSSLDNRMIYYESSRGCPFSCSYCLSSIFKGVRFFSLERVKSDLKIFVDQGLMQVKFVDRTFNANPRRSLEIMKYLKEIDNGVTNFHFELTASLLDDETLTFLKDVREGLFQFEIGVQSTYDETMTAIHRPIPFEKITHAVKSISSYRNSHIHLDLIAGLPFENLERFLYSFDDVYNLKPELLQLGFLKLLKGTVIRQNADHYGYVFYDEAPYEVLGNKFISYEDLLKLKDLEEVVEHFYNTKKFKVSMDFLMGSFERPALGFMALSEYLREMGFFDMAHSVTYMYECLIAFGKTLDVDQLILIELMKYDALMVKRKRLGFFESAFPDDFKNKCHMFLQNDANLREYLPQYLGTPAKQVIKYVHFEPFSYDMERLIDSGFKDIVDTQTTMLFDYDLKHRVFNNGKAMKIDLEEQ